MSYPRIRITESELALKVLAGEVYDYRVEGRPETYKVHNRFDGMLVRDHHPPWMNTWIMWCMNPNRIPNHHPGGLWYVVEIVPDKPQKRRKAKSR